MLAQAGGEEYDVAVSAASNATLVSVTAPTIAGYTGVVRTPGCPRLIRVSTLRGTPTGTLRGTPRVLYGVPHGYSTGYSTGYHGAMCL